MTMNDAGTQPNTIDACGVCGGDESECALGNAPLILNNQADAQNERGVHALDLDGISYYACQWIFMHALPCAALPCAAFFLGHCHQCFMFVYGGGGLRAYARGGNAGRAARTAHAVGDPHYLTFDGISFDYQIVGMCTPPNPSPWVLPSIRPFVPSFTHICLQCPLRKYERPSVQFVLYYFHVPSRFDSSKIWLWLTYARLAYPAQASSSSRGT
jgi:hypothetical protein